MLSGTTLAERKFYMSKGMSAEHPACTRKGVQLVAHRIQKLHLATYWIC
jgi:hypothetical protein